MASKTNPMVEVKKKRGNVANLKPVKTTEEAKEMGRKGGIASGEARRERKAMRDLLEYLLTQKDKSGSNNDLLVMSALVNKSKAGDVKAIELLLNLIGEGPKQAIDLSNSDGTLSSCHVDFTGLQQAEILAIIDKVYPNQRNEND